jgi:hypothetical protein
MHIAVALLRMSDGLNYEIIEEDAQDLHKKTNRLPANQSFSQLSQGTLANAFKLKLISEINIECAICFHSK